MYTWKMYVCAMRICKTRVRQKYVSTARLRSVAAVVEGLTLAYLCYRIAQEHQGHWATVKVSGHASPTRQRTPQVVDNWQIFYAPGHGDYACEIRSEAHESKNILRRDKLTV